MKIQDRFRPLTRSLPALALVAVTAGVAGSLLTPDSHAGPPPQKDAAHALSQTFREVARRIGPSVVGIEAIHGADDSPASFHGNRFSPDDLWRFFEGRLPDGQGEDFSMPAPRGQGTGVIVGADGTIATNNHVVEGAARLLVKLQDGRELRAELVGTDPDTDLAILKVDEHDLPAVELGDSDALEPGDWVMAVGNPFGLDHSVTVGVVSAIGRSNVGVTTYEDFIQTDAAINPGNSGGPLVDLDGRVIGINTAIRSSAGGSDGIGFAIPSSTLKSVLPHLVADGRVTRGWLGLSIQDLTPALADSFGAKERTGALVAQVVEDTPAAEAGLRVGDIVVALDRKPIHRASELSQSVARLAPDTKVELEVVREGKPLTLTVMLAERPGDLTKDARPEAAPEHAPARWGLELGRLPAELARQFDVEQGALVRRVEPGSAAEDAGLRAGDVILSVGPQAVASAADASDALRASEHAKGVRLLVRSNGGTRWVFLDPKTSE